MHCDIAAFCIAPGSHLAYPASGALLSRTRDFSSKGVTFVIIFHRNCCSLLLNGARLSNLNLISWGSAAMWPNVRGADYGLLECEVFIAGPGDLLRPDGGHPCEKKCPVWQCSRAFLAVGTSRLLVLQRLVFWKQLLQFFKAVP